MIGSGLTGEISSELLFPKGQIASEVQEIEISIGFSPKNGHFLMIIGKFGVQTCSDFWVKILIFSISPRNLKFSASIDL